MSDKKDKKSKKGKGAADGPGGASAEQKMVSAAADARAVAGIRRAKGFGGLAGFAITGFAAYLHGEMLTSILLRALIGGIAGNRVAWLAAVTVWRRVIRAEIVHGNELMLDKLRTAQLEQQTAS